MKEVDYTDMSLRQLRLRSGIAVQTQHHRPDAPREEAQFLAAIDGKGVMISHDGRATLTIGEQYHVRGFNGQYDFHFSAPVLQLFEAPFAYALLAYPGAVKAKKVRQAARMKVSIPASVRTLNNGAPTRVIILDLSVHGAMFLAPRDMGNPGDNVDIDIEFRFETEPAHLTLATTVRHCHRAEANGYHVGVSFRDVGTSDKLLLHYLTYSTTHPENA